MRIFHIFICFYLTQTVSSYNGALNLFTFYSKFRKLCLCRCGITQDEIIPTEMSWLATIHTNKAMIRGTLISDRHVISAATPLFRKSASEVTVSLGAQELCKGDHVLNSSVEAILIQPGYTSTGKYNDLALLRLRNPVQFSQFISPICMPLYDTGEMEQLIWTTSWLKDKKNNLDLCLTQISTLPMLPSQHCARSSIYPTELALSDKGCLGPMGVKGSITEDDIGSPVMTRWMPGSPFRLVGVITVASHTAVTPLFTKIVENLIWIHDNIQNDCQCF